MKTNYCSICGMKYTGWGNNAWPVNDGRCCDDCNRGIVTPRRIVDLMKRRLSPSDNQELKTK